MHGGSDAGVTGRMLGEPCDNATDPCAPGLACFDDPRTDILFTGYQAAGTPGRDIQKFGPRGGYVFLDGKRYDIKARIHTISGYSAHADQTNLLNFIKRMRHRPKHVRLVHGEPEAQAVLKNELALLGVTTD